MLKDSSWRLNIDFCDWSIDSIYCNLNEYFFHRYIYHSDIIQNIHHIHYIYKDRANLYLNFFNLIREIVIAMIHSWSLWIVATNY